jgi:hypothetical protein
MKGYYTAKEAREILGMTYSALQNQVNIGNLHPMTPPGRRQKVYPKKEVDELKREMDAWLMARTPAKASPTKFVQATAEDMPAAVELSRAVFGDLNIIPLEKRIQWLEKNPEIDYLLKQEDQIVGYFTLVPLRPETIDDLLNKRRLAKELTADDILTYEPGIPLDLYAMAIGVRPGVSLSQKRQWGTYLLLGARRVLLGLGQRGIVIRSIKAHSSKPDGIRLMRHLGLTETASSIPDMHDFMVDVEESGLPFVLDYKEALAEWRKEHETASASD